MLRSDRVRAGAPLALVFFLSACSPILALDSEADRIAEALALREGMHVADVGAGDGDWTERLARRVGPGGRVYATEVEASDLETIRQRVERAGLANVTTLLGDQQRTGLAEACCDAILLRLVYHHFQEPARMRAGLRRALRPGARLVVIDIEPQRGWAELHGVPDRGGHGIPEEELIREMAGDGFEVVSRLADWNGDDDRYCVVFRAAAPGPGESR